MPLGLAQQIITEVHCQVAAMLVRSGMPMGAALPSSLLAEFMLAVLDIA